MEFNYSKLRGRITEVYGTIEKFANAMGLSSTTLSGKLNNKVGFTQREINKACSLLSIPLEFIPVYFFSEKVKKS